MILWHPTRERLAAALASARRTLAGSDERSATDLDVVVVLAAERDPGVLDRVADRGACGNARLTLLVDGGDPGAVSYALLRRLQREGWSLALAFGTDDLLEQYQPADGNATEGGWIESLETAVELAQKFRVEVDFFLTLPARRRAPEDAVALLALLTSNRVRRVSFGYPLLLSGLGLRSDPPASEGDPRGFVAAFLAAWGERPDLLHVEDVQRLSAKLLARRAGSGGLPAPPGRPSTLYFDPRHLYRDADGPIEALREDAGSGSAEVADAADAADAAEASRRRCRDSCEYFPVCGGDLFGAKQLFNGTLDSAHNPYCDRVAKPLFDHLLAL